MIIILILKKLNDEQSHVQKIKIIFKVIMITIKNLIYIYLFNK